jgi:MFS superfamily sulfate permease-like transporter
MSAPLRRRSVDRRASKPRYRIDSTFMRAIQSRRKEKGNKSAPGLPFAETWRADVGAGLVVFLVAVPLCLGIALASGAPLFSGLITGIVGGLLVSRLSGSQLMVSGPAAGLTAIVITAIGELGSFQLFLTAVVLAGILQIILGYAKAGIIGYFFPSSVIKGMLAAIGLILILKQFPYALGAGITVADSGVAEEGLAPAAHASGGNTFTSILTAIQNVHPGALLLSVLSLVVLVLWDRPAMGRVKKMMPGALVVVVAGVIANAIFQAVAPSLALSRSALVMLPSINGIDGLMGALMFPDWSGVLNPAVGKIAITIALVASLETLLSLEATDKLDPLKRNSPANRELFAQGVGNTLSGLVGGLPMTGVIVRSSANIDAGGRTRWASFFHGVFLLVSVVAFASVLNLIPLASLAAILIYTGYKLARPKLFRDAYRLGPKQLVPFATTIVAILATDLLVGITFGLAVGAFFILLDNYRTAYFYHRDESADHHRVTITLSEDVTFLNKAGIMEMLDALPHDSVVTIDGSRSLHIDHDVIEHLHDFKETARSRNIVIELIGIPDPVPAAAGH